jgi:hypothetical protein
MLIAAFNISNTSVTAQDNLQDSIRSIHNQVEEQEVLEKQQADAQVQSEIRTGKTLSNELVNDGDTTASATKSTSGRYRYPSYSYLNAIQIQENARIQANSINQFYAEKAASKKAFALQRQLNLEDSALGLEQQMIRPHLQDDAQIQPAGTNLYIRNYYIPPPRPIIEMVATPKQLKH